LAFYLSALFFLEYVIDIGAKRTEIINDMIFGKTESAIKKLLDLSEVIERTFFYNIILLSGEYYEKNRLYDAGLITEENFQVAKRRMSLRVLSLIDEINDQYQIR